MPDFTPTMTTWLSSESAIPLIATERNKEIIRDEIGKLEWKSTKTKNRVPFTPGKALLEIMRMTPGVHLNFSWRLIALTVNLVTRSYYLLAVESEYSNGRGRSYWIDDGDHVVSVLSEFAETPPIKH